MFGTIRRHQKWLWIAISTVTIVSFVAFFSPQQQRTGGGWTSASDQVGVINGRPITRDEYGDAYHEVALLYVFRTGDWPGNDAISRQSGMLERETRNRLLMLEKIKQLDIQVSEAAVAQWIADAFRDRTDNSFRRDSYEQFVKNALPSRGLSQKDFERFARNEVAIQHLVTLAGTAGKLVTPQEAEFLLRREKEEVEAAAVFLSSSNFLSQVTVDPVAVATYYTNNQASYRVPEKVQVSYVKFAVSNYLAAADQELAKNTNLNRLIEATVQQRGTNSFTDPSGNPLSADASREQVRNEIRESVAMEQAYTNAVEFANELFELGNKTNALESLAAAKGLVSEVTEPFTRNQPPANLNVPPSFTQAASRLTPEEPFADQIIQGDDGVYIIALKQRIPSEIPPLESIRDRVAQDYLQSKALELARNAGKNLHSTITNAMAQGKTFEAAAAEANASPILLPPFSRKATSVQGLPNTTDASQLIFSAFSLTPGKVSEFVPTRSGGFVVFVKDVVQVAPEKLQAELPEFIKTLRQTRQYEAFSEWFQKEMENARISLPGDERQSSAG